MEESLFIYVAYSAFPYFSGLCGLSNSFETLLLFRAFQGFFGSGLVALSQALVIDTFPLEKRSKAISAWTFGLLAGPVVGYIGRIYN